MGGMVKTVRLSASLRTVAGAKALAVPLGADATVRDLLDALWQVSPAVAERVLDASGSLKPGFHLIADGRHVDLLQGLATPLAGTSDLLLIPPVSGG